jgi:hypothetical protein
LLRIYIGKEGSLHHPRLILLTPSVNRIKGTTMVCQSIPHSFSLYLLQRVTENLLDHTFYCNFPIKEKPYKTLAPFFLFLVRQPKVVFVEYSPKQKLTKSLTQQ